MRGFTTRRGRRVAPLVVLASAVASGCGDSADRDFCTSYAEYLAVLAPVQLSDPTSATAADALEAVDDLRDAVVGLSANADGRYVEPIETLESSLDDLHRVLVTAPADAEYATWQPLVEESIDDASDAVARLDELVGSSCDPRPESASLSNDSSNDG